MKGYETMKKQELLLLARKAKLRGRSRMSKQELTEALAALSAPAGKKPSVSSARAEPPAPVPAPAQPIPSPELPYLLGEHRACLLPQSPRKAFLYWEAAQDRIDEALRELAAPAARLVLRVYEWVGTGRLIQSHEVNGRLGSWYIDLNRPGMDIWAELVLEAEGRFALLLSSNRVRLPREEPSEEVESLWMTRRRHFEEIFRLSGGAPGGATSRGGYHGRLGRVGVDVTSWGAGKKEDTE